MAQLEENLKLGLQAVKYAKEQIKRSGNLTYMKPWRPHTNQKRNEFILGATRGGNYRKNINKQWVKDPVMAQRLNQLLQVLQSTDSAKKKDARIDLMRKQWGEDYFWGGTGKWQVSKLQTVDMIVKTTGRTKQEVEDAIDSGDTTDLMNLYDTLASAHKASKYGVGNCQEKAEVACKYILDHAPGGVRLALYALEEGHKGYTGKITGAGGDHVFAIYGLDTITNNISTLGPNAIVVDGWMNDAYPARKHLDWKHGWNYNDERINLKQLTVRNMVCVSYKAHVECLTDFGVLPPGPGHIPVPALKRTKF